MASHTALTDERELWAFNVHGVTAQHSVWSLRLACQAESKWTQVYSNGRVRKKRGLERGAQ